MTNFPIFILGCDRSGTTLLRMMLIQNPILHIPAETRFFHLLKKSPDLYGDFMLPFQRWFFIRDLQTNPANSKTFTFAAFNLTLEQAELALSEAAPTNITGAITALFRASASQEHKERWGDKTPYHVMEIPLLAKAFPDAKFIHIIRDGRDVAISLRKAGWVKSILEASHYWKKRVITGRLAGTHLSEERYYEIFYEKLLVQPEKVLQELCEWLKLEYCPEMLNYYQKTDDNQFQQYGNLFELITKPLDPSRVDAWKRSLSPIEIADFESVAGDLLVDLGYELSGAKVPLPVKTVRLVRDNLGPLSYKIRSLLKKI